MTRARVLKQTIRARAAKTGERYTTARRHVLNAIAKRTVSPSLRVVAPPAAVETPPKPRRSAATASTTKGGLSDAKAREKTGRGLDHWFDVLDRFGAVEKGHTAAARHLFDAHGVDGWYAQGITVAYERARGVRGVNQRCDGDYEVSVSKVLTAATADVIAAIVDSRQRRRWAGGLDPNLARALDAALGAKASKGFVTRPDGLARFRYKWGDTTVQFYLQPKPGDKVSVVVSNLKLASPAQVEERRATWRAALTALSKALAG
jgi:hypothetical protein